MKLKHSSVCSKHWSFLSQHFTELIVLSTSQTWQCSDGNIIIFFPCGKTGEKIGSSLCYPSVDGAWYPIKKSSTGASFDDLDEVQWSVSPSLRQPILQVIIRFYLTTELSISYSTFTTPSQKLLSYASLYSADAKRFRMSSYSDGML